MSVACIKCGDLVEGQFRPVLGRGRMERLCSNCADALSTLVRVAGDTCTLAMADARFVTWLETGRWLLRDGGSLGHEDIPDGWHGTECPCCATFAEEGD